MPRPNKSISQSSVPYHVRRTTLLPSSLREELVSLGKLQGPAAGNGKGGGDSTSVVGRKDRRKQERKQATSKPSSNSNAAKKDVKGKGKQVATSANIAESGKLDSKKRKRATENTPVPQESTSKKQKASTDTLPSTTQRRKVAPDQRTPLARLLEKAEAANGGGSRARKVAPSGLRDTTEKQEDQEIAWLEHKLGMGGRKEIQEDGLDDLLNDLDRLDEDLFGEGGESEEDEDEDEDDEQDESDEGDEQEGEMAVDLDEEGDQEDEDQILSEAELADFDTDDEQDMDTAANTLQNASTSNGVASTSKNGQASGTEEMSAAPARYIPPALRNHAAASSTSSTSAIHDPRLRRLLLGLLNRLSPTSFPTLVHSAADASSLHSLYLSHSRGAMNPLLVTLIIEIVSSQGDGIGETQIVVLAGLVKLLGTGLVGGMNASGGREFAASLVDAVVKGVDEEKDKDADGEGEGKKRMNLVAFMAELYNLQVVAAGLVFDIVKELIGNGLKEGDVEALLRILKVSGPQLRHDDPTALKQIIQLVQEQQKGIDASTMNSRTKFMVETLTNLRNNKVKPPTGVGAEAEANLKRYISNLAKKNSAPNDPLRLSLSDLRSASSKGKWWLVGAAWSGNPLVDRQAEFQNVGAASSKSNRMNGAAGDADQESNKDALLLKLAKKQGMNTDVRKRVFVAIMSSEDYVDAVDRLLSLNLTEIQQREIIRVILHCLGSEKSYNPFYTLIVSRLLTNSSTQATHSYQITLQYNLWDFFRTLGENEVGGAEMVKNASGGGEEVDSKKIRNLARAYAWWCAKSGLGLNILKPLSFPTLMQASRSFLSQFFSALFLSTQTSSPLLTVPSNLSYTASSLESLFLAVMTSNPDLAKGIGWFLENSKEMKKESRKNEVVEWARGVVLETISVGGEFGL